jgi:aryl-alcohol dehydrogenase-like predicted oxidoreductase
VNYVHLPGSDLRVSQISYGTTGFDGSFPEDQGLSLVGLYLESGGNFMDTAHCYSFWMPNGLGASERFVGKAAREFGRERFVIATKGGHTAAPPDYPRPDAFMSPEIVAQDLEESLDRLQLDQVDLYYLHRDDPGIPVDEVVSALNEHVVSGKIRALGASNWSVGRYQAANAYAKHKGLQPFVVLQNQWSLAEPSWSDLDSCGAMRYVLDSELSELTAAQILVAAYTATAGGYFATKGQSGGYGSDLNRRRLAAVQDLAGRRGLSPNQIALAYLLNQPFPVIPIVGTRNPQHLKEALASLEVNLSNEEVVALRA